MFKNFHFEALERLGKNEMKATRSNLQSCLLIKTVEDFACFTYDGLL